MNCQLHRVPFHSHRVSGLTTLVLAACAALVPQSGLSQQVADDSAPRPNIILVMADDLGWSDLGCYGGEIPTPHIDSLARDGMRFSQFYNNAICGPTRASLLTGLYCQQTGHRGTNWNDPKDYRRCVLISEVLQKSGYHTMMVGKWQGRDPAVDRGFDRFFGPRCQGKVSYFDEVVLNPHYLNGKRWELPDDYYMTDAFNDYAAEFLREAVQQKEPYFLYVGHLAPHWPLHAREAEIARYRKLYREKGWDEWRAERFAKLQQSGLIPAEWKLPPRPASVPDWKSVNHKEWQAERMAVYAAMVESIDRGLGQLLQIVDDAGQRENTLVLFLSDNGASPSGTVGPSKSGFGFSPGAANDKWRLDGEAIKPGSGPDLMPGPADTFAACGPAWAWLSNSPWRGSKSTAWEGGIRTPLIARWPGVIESNSLTRQSGHVMDIMATCLEIAGTEYPQKFGDRTPLPMEGKSLLPVLKGETRQGHEAICFQLRNEAAVVMGRWKGVRTRKGKQWMLFDLDTDGSETTDIADQHPEKVQAIDTAFRNWQQKIKAR